MDSLRISNQIGTIISNWESWRKAFIEVDNEKHWKEGRSAERLAKHFYPDNSNLDGLDFIEQYLKAIGIQTPQFEYAIIEHESLFDNFRGKGRMQDMVIFANSSESSITICIEAKVDEPFGDKISKAYKKAEKELEKNPNSKRSDRITNLCNTYLNGKNPKEEETIEYQLLHYLAGSITEGKKRGGIVIMPIFAYSADSQNNSSNEEAYKAFIKAVGFDLKSPIGDIEGTPIYSRKFDGVKVYTSYNKFDKDFQPIK